MISAFMYTFNTFITPDQLLSTLIHIFMYPYNLQPPEERPIDNEESKEYVNLVRSRIVQVLATWLQIHFYDFIENPELETKLSKFIQNHLENGDEKVAASGAKLLLEMIQNKLHQEKTRDACLEEEFSYDKWRKETLYVEIPEESKKENSEEEEEKQEEKREEKQEKLEEEQKENPEEKQEEKREEKQEKLEEEQKENPEENPEEKQEEKQEKQEEKQEEEQEEKQEEKQEQEDKEEEKQEKQEVPPERPRKNTPKLPRPNSLPPTRPPHPPTRRLYDTRTHSNPELAVKKPEESSDADGIFHFVSADLSNPRKITVITKSSSSKDLRAQESGFGSREKELSSNDLLSREKEFSNSGLRRSREKELVDSPKTESVMGKLARKNREKRASEMAKEGLWADTKTELLEFGASLTFSVASKREATEKMSRKRESQAKEGRGEEEREEEGEGEEEEGKETETETIDVTKEETENGLSEAVNVHSRKTSRSTPAEAPSPILPEYLSFGYFDLLDLDPVEVARQLTIKSFTCYRRILLKEFLCLGWTTSDAEQKSPNILKFTKLFNRHSDWTKTYCVMPQTPSGRATVISKFIKIATHCFALQNYSTAMGITVALNSTPVQRLKASWELVSEKDIDALVRLEVLLSPASSYKVLRARMKSAEPPAIPYLGILQSDLLFLDGGNPNFLGESNNLVNFEKKVKESRVLRLIQKYQSVPYKLIVVPGIQKYLKYIKVLQDDAIYSLSLEREKRKPKQ
eukprot:TRINITY_DN6095_c0_g3_i6.p1 TRINITY_DN6095_c0_g3~~TRINITY_DN6095_c0_g3_i6.p1  ORF type:complete len:848 (-),score=287.05 TRINITY_DN6095_c0_g3_i6:3-2246(-)